MRGDREYLDFTIERALRGAKGPLCVPDLALRLARTQRGVLVALRRMQAAGRVRCEGRGRTDDPLRWSLCTLPMDAWPR